MHKKYLIFLLRDGIGNGAITSWLIPFAYEGNVGNWFVLSTGNLPDSYKLNRNGFHDTFFNFDLITDVSFLTYFT